MKIRNPFKDYLGRWKDDTTKTEKSVLENNYFAIVVCGTIPLI